MRPKYVEILPLIFAISFTRNTSRKTFLPMTIATKTICVHEIGIGKCIGEAMVLLIKLYC